jgi:hypothetical protein
MYAQPNKNKVTFIDDLPNLEELESGGDTQSMHGVGNHNPFQQGNVPEKFQKFIRNPDGRHQPPNESGMNSTHQQHQQQQQQQHQHQQHQQQEFFEKPVQQQFSNTPSCLEVHDHVQTCPICSRFFKNDNSAYIIAIVILAIICILLLKKVLNL